MKAALVQEGIQCSVDVKPQEECHEQMGGERWSAESSLFSSPASTLFRDQLQQMMSQPESRHDVLVPIWARRMCGRWLLTQRLRRRITTQMIADRVGVGAEALQALELGLMNDAGADDWLERMALLLADTQRDPDLLMAVLHVVLGKAALSPTVFECVVADARPLEPPLDDVDLTDSH